MDINRNVGVSLGKWKRECLRVGVSLSPHMQMRGALSPYQEMEVALSGCIFETIYRKREALSGCVIDCIYRNEWVWLDNHRWEWVGG